MATILLCTLPLASSTNAVLKLAKTLRDRGHRVAYCGMKDGEAMVAPYGFEFVPVFEDWFPRGFVDGWIRNSVDAPSWSRHVASLLEERRKLLRHEDFINFLIRGGHDAFRAAIRPWAPDLILVDASLHTHWALVAYRSGVKCAYVNPILPMTEDALVPPANSSLPPGTDALSRMRVRIAWHLFFGRRWSLNAAASLTGVTNWVEHLRRLAQACEYPLARFTTRTELMPVLDLPTLVMCPEALEFPQAIGKPNRHYIEASIDLTRAEPDFPWERLDSSKALVYCSLGSIAVSPSFVQRVVDAAAREPGWQLVFNIGTTLDASRFSGVPSDAILVNGAPQLRLLERSAVMINHGGIGTAKECLYYGVPQVVFPVYFDQPGLAARVSYHRIGAVGNFRNVTPDGVRELVNGVLGDAAMKARVRAMSREFQELEREQRGAQLIDRLLEQPAPR